MNEANPYRPTKLEPDSHRREADVTSRVTFGWNLVPMLFCLALASGFGFVACMVIAGVFDIIQKLDQQSYPAAELLTSMIITLIASSLTIAQLLAARLWLRRAYIRASAYMSIGLACHVVASSVKRDSLYQVVKKLTIFLGLDA